MDFAGEAVAAAELRAGRRKGCARQAEVQDTRKLSEAHVIRDDLVVAFVDFGNQVRGIENDMKTKCATTKPTPA